MDRKKNTFLIAHRGATDLEPENTLKAFEVAIELGADFIEFDVRKTKDEEIVIMHDPGVFRTTHRFGLVKRLNLKKIKSLNVGNGEKIPTLRELLQATKGKVGYMCEIKVKGIAEEVVKILSEKNGLDSTILISFKHKELIKCQIENPELKLGAIIPSGFKWITGWFFRNKLISNLKNFFSINPFYPLVNKKFVTLAHENGLKVFPWTVNSKSKMEKLISIGVDGILTNNIKKFKNLIQQCDKTEFKN
jgi:glycerophosphoryl diester phosphodiesterase